MGKRTWTRRRFLRTAVWAALGGAAAACRPSRKLETPSPVASEGVTPSPTQAVERLLGNENRPDVKPDWNVRYFQPYRPIDLETWQLAIDGLVRVPQPLTMGDLMDLPRVEQDTRMKCVECWSARAVFAGFTYETLVEIVRPRPEAAWVIFECADGYYESLSIEELSQPRVLFAYAMDGEPLLPEFGAPLRMVVPSKYGYKWPKAITRLRFEPEEEKGYWPSVGPYTADGYVEPGKDKPLDLDGVREIDGGEINEY
jgi:DMSO/TMAO reductase YedYZ molybdopterin-dependent catalytic subunit